MGGSGHSQITVHAETVKRQPERSASVSRSGAGFRRRGGRSGRGIRIRSGLRLQIGFSGCRRIDDRPRSRLPTRGTFRRGIVSLAARRSPRRALDPGPHPPRVVGDRLDAKTSIDVGRAQAFGSSSREDSEALRLRIELVRSGHNHSLRLWKRTTSIQVPQYRSLVNDRQPV